MTTHIAKIRFCMAIWSRMPRIATVAFAVGRDLIGPRNPLVTSSNISHPENDNGRDAFPLQEAAMSCMHTL